MTDRERQSLTDLLDTITKIPSVDEATKVRAGFLLSYFRLGRISGGLYHGLFR